MLSLRSGGEKKGVLSFDSGGERWDKNLVKSQRPKQEGKSRTTLALEKHRALMNKLSAAERRRLRRRAAELLYGREVIAPGG